ncbi:MAG: PilZ domain-containing protein [Gammaproteobacteria bacterium]|nr:PilZ domain-containing protein [Gammaproteobacteria bacterium]
MRRYIRHPSDIPIEYKIQKAASAKVQCLTNVSLGGLAFTTPEHIEPDGVILVKIPFVSPPFEAYAKVVWCVAHEEGGFEVGTELMDQEDAFRARMIEQICHIEHYKREVASSEGRILNGEEAAREWIALFAAEFPRIEESDA